MYIYSAGLNGYWSPYMFEHVHVSIVKILFMLSMLI